MSADAARRQSGCEPGTGVRRRRQEGQAVRTASEARDTRARAIAGIGTTVANPPEAGSGRNP